MKAQVLVKFGIAAEAFELREQKTPEPAEDEVLIAVEATGLNFADVMARNGMYKDAPPLPCVLGYDVVGRVEKAGNKVAGELIGKRVVAMTRFGGYASHAVTKANAVAPISEDYPAGKAAALATQYCTAWYSACEMTNLREGDTVLVHAAAGGVGTALVQIAKLKGCSVIGTCGSDEKMDYLRKQGVDYPINYNTEEYEAAVVKILGPKKLNVSFNSLGGSTFKKDMRLLNFGGRIVCFGAAERAGKKGGLLATIAFAWRFGIMSPIALIMQSKSIIGVNMLRIADHQPQLIKQCMQEVTALALAGKLAPQVGAEYPAEDIDKAQDYLESRSSMGKIVVKWQQ